MSASQIIPRMEPSLPTDDELYANLPDDPEQAFLYLENHFRTQCDRERARLGEEDRGDTIYQQYICKILAAIEQLELTPEFGRQEVPTLKDVSYLTYVDFIKDVEHYKTKTRIKLSRRAKGYSVALDAPTKTKIGHFLKQIRDIIEVLEVSQDKKEALYAKVNALQEEVDRDRTRYEAFADLFIETAGTIDEAAGKLGKFRELLDTIARLIWGAKQAEAPKLPAPTERKRIEKHQRPKFDDEIPF